MHQISRSFVDMEYDFPRYPTINDPAVQLTDEERAQIQSLGGLDKLIEEFK